MRSVPSCQHPMIDKMLRLPKHPGYERRSSPAVCICCVSPHAHSIFIFEVYIRSTDHQKYFINAKMNITFQSLRYIKHRPWDALFVVIWAKIKRGYRKASMFQTQLKLSTVSIIKRSQLFR